MNKPSDDTKTVVHHDIKVAMLSQTPWLLPPNVRANILLDKQFGKEQISQLTGDIKELADGVNIFIGENAQTKKELKQYLYIGQMYL